MPRYLIAATSALLFNSPAMGTELSIADKSQIIRMILSLKAKEISKPSCVEGHLAHNDIYDKSEAAKLPLTERELPSSFKICGSVRANSIYTVYDPQILIPDWVSVRIEWWCGAMCGQGERYTLQRMGKSWKITEKQITRIS